LRKDPSIHSQAVISGGSAGGGGGIGGRRGEEERKESNPPSKKRNFLQKFREIEINWQPRKKEKKILLKPSCINPQGKGAKI